MNFIAIRFTIYFSYFLKTSKPMSSDRNPLKHPSDLFSDPSSELNTLFEQVRTLHNLQQLLYRYLPLSTQSHIRVAAYRDDVLYLVTDSAHWVTRLRYQERELTDKLKSEQPFQHLHRIHIAVRPWYKPLVEGHPAKQISTQNAEQMVTAAKYIEDEPLRKALIKLSLNSDNGNMADD